MGGATNEVKGSTAVLAYLSRPDLPPAFAKTPTHLGPGALVNEGREHGPNVAEKVGSVDDVALPHHLREKELVHVSSHLEKPDERFRHLPG